MMLEKNKQLIYAKRNQYGSKKHTPDEFKWLWDKEQPHSESKASSIKESLLESVSAKHFGKDFFVDIIPTNSKDVYIQFIPKKLFNDPLLKNTVAKQLEKHCSAKLKAKCESEPDHPGAGIIIKVHGFDKLIINLIK